MAVLTINQVIDNIDSFIENVRSLSKSYYIAIGRPNAWDDDNNPPAANATIEETELSVYRDLVYGKFIFDDDISYMIRNIEWTNNTVYDSYSQYSNTLAVETCMCYVITDNNEVYKCIYNNANSASTIKPSHNITSGVFNTSDGYIWKYMFTIDTAKNAKFGTESYVPVTVNSEVESYAVPGTIDYIELSNTGSGYDVYESGFIRSIDQTGTYVVLPNTSSSSDDYYVGSTLYVKSGAGAGQIKDISNYVASTKTITVDTPFEIDINLNLSTTANISVDDVITQNTAKILYANSIGSFNLDTTIVQSDTYASGIIKFSNSTYFIVSKNNSSNAFANGYPIYNTSQDWTSMNSNVVTTASNNIIRANTADFSANTLYANGNYIAVAGKLSNITIVSAGLGYTNSTYLTINSIINGGSNATVNVVANSIGSITALNINAVGSGFMTANVTSDITIVNGGSGNGAVFNATALITQIRRITSVVNSTVIIVDNTTPFSANLTTSNHYIVPIAAVASNVTTNNPSGTVNYTNLEGITLEITGITPTTGEFITGEYIDQVGGTTGIVCFANDIYMELTTVSGPAFGVGNTIIGRSSNTSATISRVSNFPNITVTNAAAAEYLLGIPISINGVLSNATLVSTSVRPNSLSEYIISPKVTITGDGNGAIAYAYIDTGNTNLARNITSIVMINNGNNYTTANVVITTNSEHVTTNATATAIISPIDGHGANAYMELGAKYAGISVEFSNGANENYYLPVNGKYRRIFILEDPLFDGTTIQLDTFDRVNLYLANTNGTSFINGEIAYQSTSGKAGIVVASNSTYVQLKGVLGTESGLPFNTASEDDETTNIIGLQSGASANVLSVSLNRFSNVIYFSSNNHDIIQVGTNSTATISSVVNSTSIELTNILGHFNANDIIYDATINAYANVVSIKIHGNTIDRTNDFGHEFNQICRFPLTANTGSFTLFEEVTQSNTNASGIVLNTNTCIDVAIDANTISIINGDYIETTTGGSAYVVYSNGSYIKCNGANGTFGVGANVTIGNTVVGAITNVYPVLMLYNIYNTFENGNTSYAIITGANSGATGYCNTVNGIKYPDLIRNSGAISYMENVEPFERSVTSKEKINIIIKF